MMQITRRRFLEGTVAGVGAALAGGQLPAAAAEAPAKRFGPADLVPLGKTGLKVSRVSLGTGMCGGNRQSNHTRMGEAKFDALVKHSLDQGIRFFDLADLYGTHPHFARAVKGVPRDQVVILTKIWLGKGGIPEPERPPADEVVKRFLRELQTDTLDVVLLHCQTDPNWPKLHEAQMERLARLKEQGVIRAKGVSVHSLPALEAAAKEPWVDTVNVRINPFGVKMDAPTDQVVPVLRRLHEAGKGVVGMKIIGEGDFRHDAEKKDKSIAFALTCGCVDAMTVGCETPAEVDDLIARIRQVAA